MKPRPEAARPLAEWLRVGTWAHILHPDPVRVEPFEGSRVVTKLHYVTEDTG